MAPWISIIFWLITHASEIIGLLQQFLLIIHAMPQTEAKIVQQQLSIARDNNDVNLAKQIVGLTCRDKGSVACPATLVE